MAAEDTPTRKRHALIADDEEPTLFGVMLALRDKGWEATGAKNGVEAFELAVKNDFDVLVFDQRMPGMYGLEIVQKLRISFEAGGLGHDVPPVIMITNYMDADLIRRAHAVGVKVLSKPITYAAMPGIVNREFELAEWRKARIAAAAATQALPQPNLREEAAG